MLLIMDVGGDMSVGQVWRDAKYQESDHWVMNGQLAERQSPKFMTLASFRCHLEMISQ